MKFSEFKRNLADQCISSTTFRWKVISRKKTKKKKKIYLNASKGKEKEKKAFGERLFEEMIPCGKRSKSEANKLERR